MTDSLTIWGTDYTGVKGFKANDGNDNTLAYVRPQGTKSITENGTGIDVAEYAAVDVSVSGGGSPTLQTKTKNYTPTESEQTEAVTADSGYDGLDTVNVTVGAISSSYVGSGITRRSSSDLTVSGNTVSTPAGYYESSASKSVASGTEGTPTATKGAVSNHSVSVTPSVTNSAGYIQGGTKTGTGVSVSASELVSGTKSITENGTGIDVTNYESVDVNVSGGSAKNIQVYSGYDSMAVRNYEATDVMLTVAKTGTYKITWMAWRGSSTGSMGTNLHIGSTEESTNHTTWTGTYGQCITLSDQSLTQGQVLTLYAASGNTSRTIYVGNLIIEEQ